MIGQKYPLNVCIYLFAASWCFLDPAEFSIRIIGLIYFSTGVCIVVSCEYSLRLTASWMLDAYL